MRQLAAGVLVLVACGAHAGIACAADDRSDAAQPSPPTALWQRFPLGEAGSLNTTQPQLLEAPRGGRATVPLPRGQSRDTLPLALTVAIEALLIGALVALFALALMRRQTQLRRGREAVATRASEWVNYAEHLARWTGGSEQSGEGEMGQGEHFGEEQASSGEQQTPEQPGALTAAEVGERVSGILSAAEATAEQIRSEAREAATAVREEAEAAAAARRAELERVSAEVETTARETREAADAYAEQRRREAEQDANRLLTEAEREARELRDAAETTAKQVEAEAHAHANELEEYTGGLETYLRDVVAALHETSSRLESVIAVPSETEQETLLEALDVERRTPSA